MEAMKKLYSTIVEKLSWPLKQIDETDFDTLMEFLFYKDPDVRYIKGKKYVRTSDPKWL
jgi:hypothetical protein